MFASFCLLCCHCCKLYPNFIAAILNKPFGFGFGKFVRATEALHGMEAVAEHINEMQKIYEEYGRTFDELAKQYRDVYPHSKVSLFTFVCCAFVHLQNVRTCIYSRELIKKFTP